MTEVIYVIVKLDKLSDFSRYKNTRTSVIIRALSPPPPSPPRAQPHRDLSSGRCRTGREAGRRWRRSQFLRGIPSGGDQEAPQALPPSLRLPMLAVPPFVRGGERLASSWQCALEVVSSLVRRLEFTPRMPCLYVKISNHVRRCMYVRMLYNK